MKCVKSLLLSSFVFTLVLGLGACGGGGSGSSAPSSPSFSGTEGVLYSFGSTAHAFDDGAAPLVGKLLLASNGNFYGMTRYGGSNGHGTVFELTAQGTEKVLWSFGGKGDGTQPFGSLIQDSQGNLYGMTTSGGAHGQGTVFELTLGTTPTEKVLWSFGGTDSTGKTDGFEPTGSLIQDSNGNFYGTTTYGGVNGYSGGTVFELTPGTTPTETVLWSFGGAGDGQNPQGSLILYNGNFYGMTNGGGTNSKGTVFELTPGTTPSETVLWSFGGTGDGVNPQASLIQYNGNFYGMTLGGGAKGYGTVFELTPGSTPTEKVLWSFGGTGDGASPYGSLIQYNGNFYGMTYGGGTNSKGTVFELTPGTTPSETVLWSFGGTGDGQNPKGSLIQDSQGNLYGMTNIGGANNQGIVFSLNPATLQETVLHSFTDGSDANAPDGDLIQDNKGNFYGMTIQGGANNMGTVFELSPQGTEKILWSFGAKDSAGHTDGASPYGSLIQDSQGNLYGMTSAGGTYNLGTVFELTPGTTPSEKVLWTFGNTDSAGNADGENPNGSLTQYNGNFYGTTQYGGANSKGTVFELTPGTTPSETVLWSFGGTGDGAYPMGSLIQDTQGNFYGTTNSGGAYGNGTVFELTPQGTEKLLWSFGGTGDGVWPYGSLIQDSQGNLYGTTDSGGAHRYGTVFELTPGTIPSETVLWSFGGTGDGTYPDGSLIQDNQGNLYGTTTNGGTNGQGIMFELTPGTTPSETVLWSFGGTGDGAYPVGSLIQGSDGNFYGMTSAGGAFALGTVVGIKHP